jgi:uncharacterized protein (TIGR02246 family)
MVRMLLGLMALMIAMPSAAQVAADPDTDTRASTEPRYQIEQAMKASDEGWNRGDIDAFLGIYSDDPATSFVGSRGVSRGKAGIRATYLKSYADQFGADRDPAKMSKLSFTFEDFRVIGADHALLIARWTLVTPDGKSQTGMTSLLFRKEAGGWRIIADHSS